MATVDLMCTVHFFMDMFKNQDMHGKVGSDVASATGEHNMEESCFCPLAQGFA